MHPASTSAAHTHRARPRCAWPQAGPFSLSPTTAAARHAQGSLPSSQTLILIPLSLHSPHPAATTGVVSRRSPSPPQARPPGAARRPRRHGRGLPAPLAVPAAMGAASLRRSPSPLPWVTPHAVAIPWMPSLCAPRLHRRRRPVAAVTRPSPTSSGPPPVPLALAAAELRVRVGMSTPDRRARRHDHARVVPCLGRGSGAHCRSCRAVPYSTFGHL
ncbi:hypothetical protein PVAP13_8KG035751 [Panicum virgatum]|uniref:Uncharacterized protein n=1 Tax=Panicum virgatum TaxID=38727 RepID=A0A8T0PDK4_PANVG|nr:hypothetical protein PVAP13_8KG035751 [Panicum virgatum]